MQLLHVPTKNHKRRRHRERSNHELAASWEIGLDTAGVLILSEPDVIITQEEKNRNAPEGFPQWERHPGFTPNWFCQDSPWGVLTTAKASHHAPVRSQLPTGSTGSKNLTGQLIILTGWGNWCHVLSLNSWLFQLMLVFLLKVKIIYSHHLQTEHARTHSHTSYYSTPSVLSSMEMEICPGQIIISVGPWFHPLMTSSLKSLEKKEEMRNQRHVCFVFF